MYNGLTDKMKISSVSTGAHMVHHGLVKTATKKIKDRGINWREEYKEKSEALRKEFDERIGPRSYIRFSGHDITTNSDYYVVVGPSIDNNRKVFFAGIKKLPRDKNKKVYSPYGEYFSTIKGALAYAGKKWGTPFPQDVPDYNTDTLVNVQIPEHVRG